MRRAFTLIELLVVITIIAILAAILFPVFANANAAAKTSVCLSNMRQVGLASQLYLNENDGQFFSASKYDPLPGFAPQKTWIGYDNNNGPLVGEFYGDVTKPAVNPPREGFLDPFLRSEGLKQCPNKGATVQTALALNGFDPNLPSNYYVENARAQGKEFGPSMMQSATIEGVLDTVGAPESMVEEPADTLLAWEHLAYAPQCNFLQSPSWFNGPPQQQNLKDHFNFLHGGATTTLWVDGHTKRVPYGALKRRMFSVRKDIYAGL